MNEVKGQEDAVGKAGIWFRAIKVDIGVVDAPAEPEYLPCEEEEEETLASMEEALTGGV